MKLSFIVVAISAIAAPAIADPLAPLFERLESIGAPGFEADIRAGFTEAELAIAEGQRRIAEAEQAFIDIEAGFREVEAGFGQVKDGFRRVEAEFENINRDVASVAALSALQFAPQSRGLQIAGGFAFSPRHSIPAGAIGLGYRAGPVFLSAGASFTDRGLSVATVGATVILGSR